MDKEYWERRLQAYIDNELGPADRAAMEQHMESDPECKANYLYFSALKRRLHAHADSVTIPECVETRIQRRIKRERFRVITSRWLQASLALAAVLVMALIIPKFNKPAYQFEEMVVNGQLVCHGCHVAKQAGLTMGDLCQGGHRLGLLAKHGKLYQFAADELGDEIRRNTSMYGQRVRIYGELLEAEKLIRIKRVEQITKQQAFLE